ncbi:MAG: Tad domain-containing protein [Bacilli bacterium]|nr:Tad domain-containing protein [Bacilli bacterium]
MMNKKGQVLVCFVLLIPIIIMFLGLIVDVGSNLSERKRIDNTLNSIISYSLKNKEVVTEEMILENLNENLNYENVNIVLNEETIEITLTKNSNSVFDKLFEIGINEIEMTLIGDFETGEITRK